MALSFFLFFTSPSDHAFAQSNSEHIAEGNALYAQAGGAIYNYIVYPSAKTLLAAEQAASLVLPYNDILNNYGIGLYDALYNSLTEHANIQMKITHYVALVNKPVDDKDNSFADSVAVDAGHRIAGNAGPSIPRRQCL